MKSDKSAAVPKKTRSTTSQAKISVLAPLIIVAVAVLIGAGGYMYRQNRKVETAQAPVVNPTPSAANPENSAVADLTPPASMPNGVEIISLNIVKTNRDKIALRGSLKNQGPDAFAHIDVTFDLFDRTDQKIGTTIASLNDFQVGSQWSFESDALSAEVTRVTVQKVDADKNPLPSAN